MPNWSDPQALRGISARNDEANHDDGIRLRDQLLCDHALICRLMTTPSSSPEQDCGRRSSREPPEERETHRSRRWPIWLISVRLIDNYTLQGPSPVRPLWRGVNELTISDANQSSRVSRHGRTPIPRPWVRFGEGSNLFSKERLWGTQWRSRPSSWWRFGTGAEAPRVQRRRWKGWLPSVRL